MPIPFSLYSSIKNNYIFNYRGNNTEYLIQLKLLRKQLKQQFPEIPFYISTDQKYEYLLHDESNILFDLDKNCGYVRNILCDMITHPIFALMEESNLEIKTCDKEMINNDSNLCVVLTHGLAPTASLDKLEIQKIVQKYHNLGYEIEINKFWKEAKIVVGVENEVFFHAASLGIRTSLVATGLGTTLYKKMFPITGNLEN